MEVVESNKKWEEITNNWRILCLGNVSKNFSVDNMKKTESYGCFYEFSFDCDVVTVDDILDIYIVTRNKPWLENITAFECVP